MIGKEKDTNQVRAIKIRQFKIFYEELKINMVVDFQQVRLQFMAQLSIMRRAHAILMVVYR